MRAEFIQPADTRWTDFLNSTWHDVYHTPEYVTVCAKHEEADPTAFYATSARTACLAPLLFRNLPEDLEAPPHWGDAISPYGYPGLLLRGDTSPDAVAECLNTLTTSARNAGIVSMFVRLHPLMPLASIPQSSNATLIRHGETVYVDLSNSEEEMWAQTRANHRTQIRKLERMGFQVKINDWELLPDFISIYTQRMLELGAAEYYIFPDSYFKDLQRHLGDRVLLCSVISPDGRTAAAGLFTAVDGIVQYHLGATASEYSSVAPSKLMFHFVRSWAKSQQHRLFHLGGGFGCNSDSLFSFKAGFSKLRAEFHTLRLVCDPTKYADLLGRAKRRLTGSRDEADSFFPQYRDMSAIVLSLASCAL